MKLDAEHSKWLKSKGLQAVFEAVETAGGNVRIAGGAVRNSLMKLPVSDVDLSTTLLPEETMRALERAGIKAVPTGIAHGTITAVAGKTGYEITTLREDIETDGRHAVVRFGTDWKRDAARRDLTMNALYCDRSGNVFDPLDGLADLQSGNVRFIGKASERIEEDYLRILRFFRFFAVYGSGRPDGEGLKACSRLKDGLSRVSVERVWQELRKLLAADDPSRALLWMRTTGVLSRVVPESEKWGIDLIPALIRSEKAYGWPPDPLLRLEAIVRPDEENMVNLSRRLKLPNLARVRLVDWVAEAPVDAGQTGSDFQKRLYHGRVNGISDRLKLQIAGATEKGEDGLAEKLLEKLNRTETWRKPEFPVKGKDLLARGNKPGTKMGKVLGELEKQWVDSGFTLSKAELLEGVKQ